MAKPEKHIFICTQNRGPGHPRGSCNQSGCGGMLDEFMFEFQKRELNGKFQLTLTGCLGPCGSGPSVLVYPEGVMYGKVSREDVATIIDEHLLGDKPVERLMIPGDLW